MIEFTVNGNAVQVEVPDDVPVLWVLREELKLLGTKFGCGRGLCGACTIHVDGQATRSCVLPVVAVKGGKVTTIEGIRKGDELHPVQTAWIESSAPQCGYCQPGQIMTACSLLAGDTKLSKADLLAGMSGNLCRCGSYHKIREAVVAAAKAMGRLTDGEGTP